jgi:putative PIN family toxin of toxin-antitoxin system
MLIVVDTNVFVSGLLNPFGPPGKIIDLILSRACRMAFDDRILAEYKDVLFRPRFSFDREQITDLLELIRLTGTHVSAPPLHVPRTLLIDHDDLPFAEVARTAKTGALITGNSRHFAFIKRHGVLVLSPKNFIEHYSFENK